MSIRETPRPHLFPLLALFCVALFFFWPFAFAGQHAVPFHFLWGAITGIPEGGDQAGVNHGFPRADPSPVIVAYPNACFAGEALRRGELPAWNPYQACGIPGLGTGQVFPFNLFLWLFYLSPSPWTYTLGLLLGCFFGALGAYLYLGTLGLDPWPRAFGAVLWTFNARSVSWLVYSSGGAEWWFGWLLWAWSKSLSRRGGRWWLPAVMVAGMVYSGHPEMSALCAGASLACALAAWTARPKDERAEARHLAVRVLAAVALAGMLTAVHWLPVLAHMGESVSYKSAQASGNVVLTYSLSSLLSPRSDIYVSPALFALVFLGLAALPKRREIFAPLSLMLLSLLLGHFIPWSPLLKVVSAGGLVRALYARALLWPGLATLAAAGAHLLLHGETFSRVKTTAALLLGFAPYVLFFAADAVWGGGRFHLVTAEWVAYCAGAVLLLLWVPWPTRPWARALALAAGLACVCLDPFMFEGFRFPYFNDRDPGRVPAVEAIRPALEASHGRMASTVDQALWPWPFLSPNMASVWHVRDARAVDVLLSRRMTELHDCFYSRKRDLFGTLISFPGQKPQILGLLGVSRLGAPLDLNSGRFAWQEIPQARARAFLVHAVVAAADEARSQTLWKELSVSGGLKDRVIVEGWRGAEKVGEPGGGESVAWIEDALSRVHLKVCAPTGGVLVLLDTYAEGWRAEVDGTAARIYPADLAFRAVPLSPGTHDVAFRYAPRALQAGEFLFAAGWLSVALLAALRWRRRGGESPEA